MKGRVPRLKATVVLLMLFTQPSIPGWNQLNLVFKVLAGSLGYRFPSSIVPILGRLLSLPFLKEGISRRFQ